MVLLLIVIYVAFIGLGIPDSLYGSALSSIIEAFSLPLSASNLVSSLVSLCTVISSLLAARLLKRFGTAAVTIVSTAITALALLGYSVSGSFVFMLLCAIPLGLGAGAIDAGLNNYIALHFGGTHMNFLHCFYGVGVIVSPCLMSIMLQRATWREGYFAAFILQACIALVLLLSFPLWKKAGKGAAVEDMAAVRTLTMKQMASHAGIRWAWVLSFTTNAIEALSGIWGATYLIRTHGLTADQGASAIILYYVGMTLGRFLSGVFADKLGSKGLIRLGICTLAVGCVLLILPVGSLPVSIAALFLVGLGNGPIYPNLVNLTPEHFGADVSASVIGSQMAVAYAGFMIAPPLFGAVAQHWGLVCLPPALCLFLALLIISRVMLRRRLKEPAA
jgi:fucose permease